MSDNKINSQIAKGAIWMILLRLSVKGISIVSTVILARLLAPEDFGLMALASSIYAMVELIRAFSFDIALIQNQQANEEHYNTAWTMNIIFALLASLLILSLSYFLSEFYDEPRLKGVLFTIALIIFIDGFSNIGTVQFRKQMNFTQEFKYQVLTKLSGFCFTIPLAWLWHSYWALLVGMCASTLTSVTLSYLLQSYRPKFSLLTIKDLFGFCSWLVFNNILRFINNHSQNFILGKLSGTHGLGVYSLSTEIGMITSAEIIAPINRAAYPGYAKIAEQREKLKATYLKTLSHITLLALPCAFGIAAITPIMVPVLLGDKWLATIPLIQLIACASALEALQTNAQYIYLALAKQKTTTKLLLLNTLIFLPLLIALSIKYGLIGAVIAFFSTSLFMTPINFIKISQLLKLGSKELFGIIYRPLIATFGMFIAINCYIANVELHGLIQNNIVFLLVAIIVGIIIYSLLLLSMWLFSGKPESAEQDIYTSIHNKIIKRTIVNG